MKKVIGRCVLVVSIIAMVLSCSMGMDPAKSGTTTVSFSIASLVPPANTVAKLTPVPGRAVAPGEGYLYIRTLGGPVGSNGPFYGPFRLASSSTFTTTEIPAGTYSHVGILYATEPLENFTAWWNEQEMTFTELMRLNDQNFLDFSDGEEENSLFDEMIAGYASGEMIENVVIRANQTNTLSARLVPIGADSSFDMDTLYAQSILPPASSDTLIRKYFKLINLHDVPGTNTTGVHVGFSAGNFFSLYMGRAMLFSEDGRNLGTHTMNRTLSEDEQAVFTSAEGERLYLYLEYRNGSPTVSTMVDLTPQTPYESIMYVSQNGRGAVDGSSPRNAIQVESIIGSYNFTNTPVVIFLDDCTVSYLIGLTANKTAFFTSGSREPIVMRGPTDSNIFNISANGNLTLSHIILDGNEEERNTSLLMVRGNATLENGVVIRNGWSGSNGAGVQVYDGGHLTMKTGSRIENCKATESSDGGAIALVTSAAYSPSFTMNGGTINNCSGRLGGAIYASGYNYTYKPTITLSGGTISGGSAQTGGGIFTTSYTELYMTGGKISGTTASAEGGGIFLGTNSTMNFSGGEISGCTSTYSYGGGICIGEFTILNLSGTAKISNCTASSGWAIGWNSDMSTITPISGTQTEDYIEGYTGNAIYDFFIP